MAKALTADPAPTGHNVSEEAVVRTYVADMVKLQAEKQAITDKIKTRRKLAKAQGVDALQELDRVIKMSTWSPDEVRDSFQRTERYARFLGLPIGSQASLFDDERVPELERTREKWGDRGFTDGVMGRGKPEEPPKECPPDARQRYGERWEEGQKKSVEDYAQANGLKAGDDTPIGEAAKEAA